jgi:hypothetical protein
MGLMRSGSEMGRLYGMHGNGYNFVQNFSWKSWRAERIDETVNEARVLY